MKPGLAICKGTLYLFGGEYENGSKQYTLNDFYSLGRRQNTIFVSLSNEKYRFFDFHAQYFENLEKKTLISLISIFHRFTQM